MTQHRILSGETWERNYADVPPDKLRVQNLEVGQSRDGSSH